VQRGLLIGVVGSYAWSEAVLVAMLFGRLSSSDIRRASPSPFWVSADLEELRERVLEVKITKGLRENDCRLISGKTRRASGSADSAGFREVVAGLAQGTRRRVARN